MKQDSNVDELKKNFDLTADRTTVSIGQLVSLTLKTNDDLVNYHTDWKASGGTLTVADDGKSAKWEADENSSKDYTITAVIEVTSQSGKKVTFKKTIKISAQLSGGGSGGGGGTPPAPEIPKGNPILVNEAAENETYTTNKDHASLTGKVETTDQIKEIIATYQPVSAEDETNITVEGTKEWTIKDIPLEIGTNNISIKVKTANKTYDRQVVINRVNETIEFAENVTSFDMENDEDMQKVNDIADSIVNYWNDDTGHLMMILMI